MNKELMTTTLYQESGFTEVLATVRQFIISDFAKEDFDRRKQAQDLTTAKRHLTETNEAVQLLASNQHVPFMGMTNIARLTAKIQRGLILEAAELTEYADFLRSFRLIRKLFVTNQYQLPLLFRYTAGLGDFSTITNEIEGAINGNRLKDDSSRELRKIRGRIQSLERDLQQALDKIIKNPTLAKYLQDRLVITKEERFTLPVRTEFQSRIKGNIIDRSSKGTTVFIEPLGVAKLNDKLILAKAEETAEVYQILAGLTGAIAERLLEIGGSREIISELDIIFARGKYARQIDGQPISVNDEEQLLLRGVTHPLLGSKAVPLDLSLGADSRGLVITGPNAGGKTVVLKTVALVCLMAASGLLPHHAGGSTVPLLKNIEIDIGDQQNLANALSTFSGHMENLSGILQRSSRGTLVLVDEIGSGTEPKEGAALGIAIMESLYAKGALVIATTHYGEIKDFALAHGDFKTAAMAFDAATLTPQYRLLMNQVGESNAFWIAAEKGLADALLVKAASYLRGDLPSGEKREFPALGKKIGKTPQPSIAAVPFHKGDRVLLTATKEVGLFYQLKEQQVAEVYVEKQRREVPVRRLQLLMPAMELYPRDYDLESLFQDFRERKFAKDLQRGSKKAQQRLRKDAAARKNLAKE